MSRSFDRQLERTMQQIKFKREPMPHFTNPADELYWRLNHGEKLEDMVRADTPRSERHLKRLEKKRERERIAYEASLPRPATAPKPEPHPPKPPEQAQPPEQPEPEQPQQWWEEKVRWRVRGPEDHDRKRHTPGRCLTEYDVLKR